MRSLYVLPLALALLPVVAAAAPLRTLSPGECAVEFWPGADRKEVKYMSVKDIGAFQDNIPKNKRDRMTCDDQLRDYLKAYASRCEVFCNPDEK